MKIRLSKGMQKCILDYKLKALEIAPTLRNGEIHKINIKPTKKKIFTFHILNLNNPMLRLFINNQFYKDYIYKDNQWVAYPVLIK